jgi:hypothetical protein
MKQNMVSIDVNNIAKPRLNVRSIPEISEKWHQQSIWRNFWINDGNWITYDLKFDFPFGLNNRSGEKQSVESSPPDCVISD